MVVFKFFYTHLCDTFLLKVAINKKIIKKTMNKIK